MEIGGEWLEIPCPACSYRMEVQVVDVLSQAYRWCRCCRAQVNLVDVDGSVAGNVDALKRALTGLNRTIEGLI